jgi:hypothetical protein
LGLGFKIQGLRFDVWCSAKKCRVEGVGCRVKGRGFVIYSQGFGLFRVKGQGLGLRVPGLRFKF